MDGDAKALEARIARLESRLEAERRMVDMLAMRISALEDWKEVEDTRAMEANERNE